MNFSVNRQAIYTLLQHICMHQIQYRDFLKALVQFAFTIICALVKNTCTYFVIFLCNFEVIAGFILLPTVTCNIQQCTTIFAYQTGCQKGQCRFLIATLIQLLFFKAFIKPNAGITLDIPNIQPSLD